MVAPAPPPSPHQTGTYFRRQVPLGPYSADFVCLKHRIVTELDGEQHGLPGAIAYDEARSSFLARQGFVVLRFWNRGDFQKIDGVLDAIAGTTSTRDGSSRTLTPDPSPQGRGEAAPHTSGSASG